jgi:hypothetical protein
VDNRLCDRLRKDIQRKLNRLTGAHRLDRRQSTLQPLRRRAGWLQLLGHLRRCFKVCCRLKRLMGRVDAAHREVLLKRGCDKRGHRAAILRHRLAEKLRYIGGDVGTEDDFVGATLAGGWDEGSGKCHLEMLARRSAASSVPTSRGEVTGRSTSGYVGWQVLESTVNHVGLVCRSM